MSTAIKVSTSLADEARAAAADADRSLTGQFEHWARLGKVIEPLLTSATVAALKKSGGDLSVLEDEAEKARVLDVLERFRELPRAELRERLGLAGKTRYEPDPEHPGALIRVLPDGTRQRGVVVDREFVPQ